MAQFKSSVACPICGKSLKTLSSHIKTHKLSIQEFKDTYPEVPIDCEEYREKRSLKAKAQWTSPEIRSKMESSISSSVKLSWSNPEVKARRLEGLKDAGFFEQTEESKSKISETLKELWQQDSYALNQVTHMLNGEGTLNSRSTGRKVTYEDKSGRIHKLHSLRELQYAFYLDNQDADWTSGSWIKTFLYYKEGRKRYYTPDFYVPADSSYIDVKGWLSEECREKIQLTSEQNSVDIRVVFAEEVDALSPLTYKVAKDKIASGTRVTYSQLYNLVFGSKRFE
ncbi:endonuclease [Bacillus phage vB_BceM-HSE3]|nr:endonuclease [Bacillus phage vB_BceM-HSE3]